MAMLVLGRVSFFWFTHPIDGMAGIVGCHENMAHHYAVDVDWI